MDTPGVCVWRGGCMAYIGNGWNSDMIEKALGNQKMTFSMIHIQNWSSPPPYPLPWETGYFGEESHGWSCCAVRHPHSWWQTQNVWVNSSRLLFRSLHPSFHVLPSVCRATRIVRCEKTEDLCKIRVSILRGLEMGDNIVSAALVCAQMWEFPSRVPLVW